MPALKDLRVALPAFKRIIFFMGIRPLKVRLIKRREDLFVKY